MTTVKRATRAEAERRGKKSVDTRPKPRRHHRQTKRTFRKRYTRRKPYVRKTNRPYVFQSSEKDLVYLLRCTGNKRTYVGFTNKHTRRIRQHSGEIKGGARTTKRLLEGTLHYVLRVKGFTCRSHTLSFEWHAKRVHGLLARVKHICKLCTEPHQ